MNILAKVNNVTSQTAAYTYDNNGNEKIITKVPYINGIVQTAEVTTCTYDKFNQLSTTATPDGTNVANTYNGEGLRVAKKVNGATTKYLYNGDKVVLELNGNNTQTARNVLGTSLISRTVGGTTLYYMYNGHADVTALVDAGGTIQAKYYYDAFGNVKEQTGNFNNNILYAGYQYDKETGLYYCNSRMYDPVTARFLQEDTYYGDPNDPLSLNLYTYCHNEPLMYIDLTGHDDAYVQYNMEHYGSVSDISEQDTGTYGNDYDVATALKAGLSYNGQTGTITVWNESERQFYYISYDLSNTYVGGTVNATITNAGTGELFRGYAVKLGDQKAAVNIRELGSYGGYNAKNVYINKASNDVKSVATPSPEAQTADSNTSNDINNKGTDSILIPFDNSLPAQQGREDAAKSLNLIMNKYSLAYGYSLKDKTYEYLYYDLYQKSVIDLARAEGNIAFIAKAADIANDAYESFNEGVGTTGGFIPATAAYTLFATVMKQALATTPGVDNAIKDLADTLGVNDRFVKDNTRLLEKLRFIENSDYRYLINDNGFTPSCYPFEDHPRDRFIEKIDERINIFNDTSLSRYKTDEENNSQQAYLGYMNKIKYMNVNYNQSVSDLKFNLKQIDKWYK